MANNAWKEEITNFVLMGNIREAISIARKFSKKYNANDIAFHLIETGIEISREKELHEDALSLFKAAARIAVEKECQDNANFNACIAMTIIGESLGERGQLIDAEKVLRKAVRMSHEFSIAQKRYGYCLLLLEKKKSAEYHFKQALKLEPDDAETHALYAMLLANTKRIKKALVHCYEAIKLDPENSKFHAILGKLLLNQNSMGEAEDEFKKAIDLEPTSLMAHYQYGILLERCSRWDEAEKQLKIVFDTDPSYLNVKPLYSNAVMNKQAANRNEKITEKWMRARKVYFETERPLDLIDFGLLKNHMKEWRSIHENFSCEMCGKCCRGTLWASHLDTRLVWEDIERWKKEERNDILKYVLIFEGLGGDVLDLENMRFFSKCPFIVIKNKKYLCSIHETKPFVCKIAPFYFHYHGVCENCRQPINTNDIYCKSCGMFLKVDPHFFLMGCPALKKTLKKLSLYKPFQKFDIFSELLR